MKATQSDPVRFHVELEFPVDDEPVFGQVSAEGHAPHPFVGWLGLLETLHALRDQTDRARTGAGRKGEM